MGDDLAVDPAVGSLEVVGCEDCEGEKRRGVHVTSYIATALLIVEHTSLLFRPRVKALKYDIAGPFIRISFISESFKGMEVMRGWISSIF